MCVVSMVSDYYMGPNYLKTTSIPQFDEETKQMLREVIKRLDDIDKRLGDRDCMDETKAEFYAAIDYKGE